MKNLHLFSLALPLLSCASTIAAPAIELISPPHPGASVSVTANGNSIAPNFSRDGRFLVFTSEASNLLPGDRNGAHLDVFAQELATRKITLVSAAPDGVSAKGHSYAPSLSADGRHIVFLSQAANLVAGDDNEAADVFLRDMTTGAITLVSVAPDGKAADGDSFPPVMTPDGRHVCFASRASNLVPIPAGNRGQIHLYLRDMTATRTSLVSADVAGGNQLDADVEDYAISDNGRWVAFTTSAIDAVAPIAGAGAPTSAYLHDVSTGTTKRIHLDAGPDGASPSPVPVLSLVFSPGGGQLALQTGPFTTQQGGAATPRGGVYLLELESGNNTLVAALGAQTPTFRADAFPLSFSADGRHLLLAHPTVAAANRYTLHVWNAGSGLAQLNSPVTGKPIPARQFSLSADGQRIVFLSDATDLLSQPTPANQFQLYGLDLASRTLRLLNANPAGEAVAGVEYASPRFSPDGGRIAFQSRSAGLVADDHNSAEDIFIHDWTSGQITLVSAAEASSKPASARRGSSLIAHGLSADGRRVLFASLADDLVPGSGNGQLNLYARDRVTRRTQLVNINANGTGPADGEFTKAVLSANGRHVAFIAKSSNLLPGSSSAGAQVYVRDLDLGRTMLASVALSGAPANGEPVDVNISPDGRFVVFMTTNGTDLVSDLTGPVAIAVRDLRLERTSAHPLQIHPQLTSSRRMPGISLDGRVFVGAPGLPVIPTSLFDAAAGLREDIASEAGSHGAISLDGRHAVLLIPGAQSPPALRRREFTGNNWSEVKLDGAPNTRFVLDSLSADGRHAVVREQPATGTAARERAFAVDLTTGTMKRFDLRPDGQIAPEAHPNDVTLSAEARLAAFRSDARDLVSAPSGTVANIFLRDLASGQTTLVSSGLDGAPAADFSSRPLLSANGRVLVFSSRADNLVPGDFNHSGDLFAVELPAAPFTDMDGDGLDDLWELANFGNLLRDGSGDFDGDGATDAEEHAIGTSPINDRSVLRVGAAMENATRLVIEWTTEPGLRYQLRYRENVTAAWSPVGELVAGDGHVSRQSVALDGSTTRFYGVVTVR